MKVSIVIPVYNEAEPLVACLEAIAAQTVQPDEVIVVDNNSTDASRKLAEAYVFTRLIQENRQGIVFARNRGYDAAAGDIIARIDADTVLPPDWVERVKSFYIKPENAARAFSGGAYFYNVRMPRAVAWLYNLLAFDLNHLLIGHPTLWGSNMALTRRQWRTVRKMVCNRQGMHEDLDLSIHLYQSGFGIFYDRQLRVGAHLNRVRSNRHELWEYLQWWPRTLRSHHKRSWLVAWLFGAAMLYMLTPLLSVIEYLARMFGLRALNEVLRAD